MGVSDWELDENRALGYALAFKSLFWGIVFQTGIFRFWYEV